MRANGSRGFQEEVKFKQRPTGLSSNSLGNQGGGVGTGNGGSRPRGAGYQGLGRDRILEGLQV